MSYMFRLSIERETNARSVELSILCVDFIWNYFLIYVNFREMADEIK